MSDALWGSVAFGSHFDWNGSSTTVVDEKAHAVTVTGDSVISAAQSKWGGASAYFPGAGYFSLAQSTDFDITGDFAISTWMFFPSGTIGNSIMVVFQKRSGPTTGFQCTVYGANGGTMRPGLWINGTTVFDNTGTAIPLNQWVWVTWTRVGNEFSIYINGTRSRNTTTAITVGAQSVVSCIGGEGTYSQYFTGYLDDLLVTKYARYATGTTITVPTGQFAQGPFIADPAMFSIGAPQLTLRHSKPIVASPANFTLTFNRANTPSTFSPFTQSGAFYVTGAYMALVTHGPSEAVPGSFSIIGSSADMSYSARSLSPGSFSVTGAPATLAAKRRVRATPGAYSMVFKDGTLARRVRVTASPATYSIVGTAATLSRPHKYYVTAAPGSFAIAAPGAPLVAHRKLYAAQGSFTYTLMPSGPPVAQAWIDTVTHHVVTRQPAANVFTVE